ncbi:MAG: tyrosine--tRNA ligase [Microgenomates group bacterium]
MSKTDEVLTRGVEQILPSKKGLADLMRKKKITLYQGFDPSMPNLHIGNWIGIRKLAQFQKLGHKVIFLIGDFTGMIGDPTDKTTTRKKMSRKQVLKNAKDYTKQVSKTLKFSGPNAAKVLFNSEWLSKLSFEDVVELASNFTVQQILERDFFQERIKREKAIHIPELLYPLMQAYDCVQMNIDLEVGGSDQLFNMLVGRSLMKKLKNKEKYVLTIKLLEDPTGKKMGKTEGNTINLTDSAENIFGKIMALPDNLINPGIELLTDLPLDFAKNKKPLTAKRKIAFDVVKQIHGDAQAFLAQDYFDKTFHKRTPEYKTFVPNKGTLLSTAAYASRASISQTKRLLSQGAIDVNGKAIKDPLFKLKGGERIKIGKKTFVKVKK